jgi:2-polyprenyl-3-methyl-5-hydroxy-6-metoxy-1,4-benzoquinol methylase
LFEDLKREWTPVYTKLHAKHFGVRADSLERALIPIRAALHPYRRNPPRVIDFGAGKGWILDALLKEQLIRSGTGLDLVPGRDPWLTQAMWEPVPGEYDFALSTDALEHLPPQTVEAVLANIRASAPHGYLLIATRPDRSGERVGRALHLTVKPAEWWMGMLAKHDFVPTYYAVRVGYDLTYVY